MNPAASAQRLMLGTGLGLLLATGFAYISGIATIDSVGAAVNVYQIVELDASTSYDFSVYAYNGIGNSDTTEVFNVLTQRKKSSEKQSYTSHLIKNPELLAKKIGEESSELIIDFIKKNKEGAIKESADLIYHVLVIWVSLGINPEEIWKELSSRKLISGIEEKKNRGVK